MPTFSGSAPRSKILSTTTAATRAPAPATSGHIGIVLARCIPPTLAIDANGPSRTNLRAGPVIARIPQTIPAAAPITIKLGVKCAAIVPPEPSSMECPNRFPRYVPSRKPVGTPHHSALAEHPAEQPDRPRADRADGPHHRSPVLDGQQDCVHCDEEADQDAGQNSQVEALCCVLEHGGGGGPGRPRRCYAGGDAVHIGRDVSTSSRQHERGRRVAR